MTMRPGEMAASQRAARDATRESSSITRWTTRRFKHGFARDVVQVAPTLIGAAGGDRNAHRADDARRALQGKLPAGCLAPSVIARASVDAATAGAPERVRARGKRQADFRHVARI